MKKFAWLLFGAIGFAASAAFAVDIKSEFSELDKNADGYVSADELSAADEPVLIRYWYRFDENNDGALDTVEFAAFEDTHIDKLEPWVLRHEWYGSVGMVDLATTPRSR